MPIKQAKHFFQNHKYSILLGLIFILSASFRFFGFDYGLPNLYLEDEEFFVQPALRVAEGPLNPGWFGAPGQTVIYFTAEVFRLVNLGVNYLNQTTLPVEMNYQADLNPFQTAGRAVSALFGSLTIFLAYSIGRHWRRRAGLWAAFLTAIAFYLVEYSHIIRPDILQTFYLLGLILAIFKLIDQPKKIVWYLLAGLAFGLAIATKYPSLFLLIPILPLLYFLYKQHRLVLKYWFLAGLTAIAATFAAAPYLVLDYQTMLKNVGLESRSVHLGHDGLGFWGNLNWYLVDTLHWQVGTLLYFLALLVSIYFLFKIKKPNPRYLKFSFLALVWLTYVISSSFLQLHWERWMIPATSILIILAAIGLSGLLKRIKKPLLITLVVIIFLAGPILRLIRLEYGFSQPHTIDYATAWLAENLPPDSVVVAERYTPTDLPVSSRLIQVDTFGQSPLAEYQKQRATHFLVSGSMYNRIEVEAHKKPDSHYARLYENYRAGIEQADLIYEIQPHPQYTSAALLHQNDLTLLLTFPVFDLRRGDCVKVFKLK